MMEGKTIERVTVAYWVSQFTFSVSNLLLLIFALLCAYDIGEERNAHFFDFKFDHDESVCQTQACDSSAVSCPQIESDFVPGSFKMAQTRSTLCFEGEPSNAGSLGNHAATGVRVSMCVDLKKDMDCDHDLCAFWTTLSILIIISVVLVGWQFYWFAAIWEPSKTYEQVKQGTIFKSLTDRFTQSHGFGLIQNEDGIKRTSFTRAIVLSVLNALLLLLILVICFMCFAYTLKVTEDYEEVLDLDAYDTMGGLDPFDTEKGCANLPEAGFIHDAALKYHVSPLDTSGDKDHSIVTGYLAMTMITGLFATFTFIFYLILVINAFRPGSYDKVSQDEGGPYPQKGLGQAGDSRGMTAFNNPVYQKMSGLAF